VVEDPLRLFYDRNASSRFAKGVPTKQLTDEMELAYPSVLKRRYRIQEAVQQGKRVGLPGEAPEEGLPDSKVEVDETYQNAEEKRKPRRNPDDPSRRRANKSRGRGFYENDRPPVLGMIGRETGWASFQVCPDTEKETVQTTVTGETSEDAIVFTDENRSYVWLDGKEESRTRKAIDHSAAWAGDRDKDCNREVHVNTTEGIWTSLRNRPRRL